MTTALKKRKNYEGLKGVLINFLGSKHFSFWAILYAFFLILFSTWFIDLLNTGIRKLAVLIGLKIIFLKFGGAIIILTVFVFLIIRINKKRSEIEVKSEPPKSVKVLVVFLSNLGRITVEEKKKIDEIKNIIKSNADDKYINKLKDLIFKSTWGMPLHAIEYHNRTLEKVYVMTSKDKENEKTNEFIKGSYREFSDFKEIFELFYKKEDFIEEFIKGGINFENIKIVFDITNKIFEYLFKNGYGKDDFIIDITGGQKPNSIAAAIATLTMESKFQYISTNPPHDVLSHDIGYIPEEKLE